MRIVIAGAGKVGYYLTKTLNEEGYKVSTIEKDYNLCERLAKEVDSLVIHGDATKLSDLEEVGVQKADVLIAATGKDEENLMICQMAKLNFGIKKTIARINNPKNEEICKALGVEFTVSSTAIIANIIEQEAIADQFKTLLTLEKGQVSMIEMTVEWNAEVRDQKIKDITLPEESILASIIRRGHVIIPRGDVVLEEGDHVIALVHVNNKKELENLFIGRKRSLFFKSLKDR